MANTLLKSRRFWMTVLDAVITLGVYFVGRYAAGEAEDARIVIAAIQPIFIALIVSYTVEEQAAIKAGVSQQYPRL